MNVLQAIMDNKECKNIFIKEGSNKLCVKHNGNIINIPNNLILSKRTKTIIRVGNEKVEIVVVYKKEEVI